MGIMMDKFDLTVFVIINTVWVFILIILTQCLIYAKK